MKRLVIFDLDGTLLNTVEDLGRAVNRALEMRGMRRHTMEEYRYFVGNGVRLLVERALTASLGTNPDAALMESVLADFMAYYIEHKSDYTKPYSGIPELIDELTDMGVKVAVASNKFIDGTRGLVKRFFPSVDFASVLGQRDGVPVKPDPQIVYDILAEAGVPAADTLYVGDTGIDMRTAASAGVESVGVEWGFRTKDELIQGGAVHIVTSPEEILKLV